MGAFSTGIAPFDFRPRSSFVFWTTIVVPRRNSLLFWTPNTSIFCYSSFLTRQNIFRDTFEKPSTWLLPNFSSLRAYHAQPLFLYGTARTSDLITFGFEGMTSFNNTWSFFQCSLQRRTFDRRAFGNRRKAPFELLTYRNLPHKANIGKGCGLKHFFSTALDDQPDDPPEIVHKILFVPGNELRKNRDFKERRFYWINY